MLNYRSGYVAVTISVGALFVLCGNLQAAPASRLRTLVLQPPFTLTYNLTARVVNLLPGMPKETLVKPVIHRIVISASGKSLLYKDETVASGVTNTVIYDGNKTYDTWTNTDGSSAGGSEKLPGFNFNLMHYAALPGVGIPYQPLLYYDIPASDQSAILREQYRKLFSVDDKYLSDAGLNAPGVTRDLGIVDRSDVASGRLDQVIGVAGSVADSGQTKVLWYYSPNDVAPNFISEYRNHQLFKGLWLAANINERIYLETPPPPGEPPTAPLFETRDYTLDTATDTPLAPSNYMITSYLPPLTNIYDLTGKTPSSYVYLRNHGTLDEQAARQEAIRSAAMAQRSRPSPASGLFLCASLMLSFATIGYWRFQDTRRANKDA